MFWGFRYECFYFNVDISQSTTLPKGKPNVNSGLFKGLDEVKSYFWQAVLKTWIDNNRADRTSSGCTLLWKNVTCQSQVMYFPIKVYVNR